MDPLRRNARIAGLLYLVVVLSGPFLLLYVPGKLFVAGDASATASNILAQESLYRAYIVVGVVGELFFVATVLALYGLLRTVQREVAAVMALLILIDVPRAFLGVANEVAALALLRGNGFLDSFGEAQRQALATLLIEIDRHGIYVAEIFWGLWLLPLGWLIHRSGFLPRLLGIWLFANGLAYLVMSGTGLLAPERYAAVARLATPILFGEMALMLWLLVVGARERSAPADATR